MTLARCTANLVTEKLDQNSITLAEAKEFLRAAYRISIKAQNKAQFIRRMYVLVIDGEKQRQ